MTPRNLIGRPWLQTYTGKAWCADDPGGYLYTVEEIAHGLANECRYSGQCKEFYSVAQHSVIVMELVEAEILSTCIGPSRGLLKAALLHDAAEAYCKDIPSPIKNMVGMEWYKAWENKVGECILDQFGLLEHIKHPVIKWADLKALATEKRDIMGSTIYDRMWTETVIGSLPPPREKAIKPLSPKQAKGLFMRAWNRINNDYR